MNEQNIIFYNTADGKVKVALMAKDGQIWMNQNQLSELFVTSVQNVSSHIINILNDKELKGSSVIKDYLITAVDGKEYNVKFYSLDMNSYLCVVGGYPSACTVLLSGNCLNPSPKVS